MTSHWAKKASSPSTTSSHHIRDEPLVAPFAGWMVRPNWAERVISRSYDNLTPAQRRNLIATNPYSYMNVTRGPEVDLDSTADQEHQPPTDLIAHGRSALARLLSVEAFVPSKRKALYLYRLNHSQGQQIGLVCTVAVAGFEDGRIRVHENVHNERADLLKNHLLGVGATSSPVAMTIRSSDDLLDELQNITSNKPAELEFGSDEVCHQIWTVPEARTKRLLNLLSERVLYVTDGHHRSAAATRALEAEPHNPVLSRLLSVLFCDQQLHVQAFHRLAVDQHNRHPQDCLTALAAHTKVEPATSPHTAQRGTAGTAGLYLAGNWYRLAIPPATDTSAVSALDVERLRKHVLWPILGVDELNHLDAVEYLPASAGYQEMTRKCDAEARIGFALCPMSVSELIDVADEGGLMPPKSSFFAPKPRSGVFLRMLGRGATAHLPAS
ncbi:MAG: DUF1015 domain-containing protein [Acidimicrobiia bacterium]|nr:DUF1015 domain-containing protein [Acidimicrobiia bacterium]MYC58157.1 DUF1015 domain-containing protein [Acidimicrobiia bacterium]MYG94356.1 DUF1015 domain-containing protein [Acidimicrobiia bacterium]MYI30589.1 DUF1015 domain-containing protein [Acidimicrobiia bacterium]